MSTPFSGTVASTSNGVVTITPDNQFDIQALEVGASVTVDSAEEVSEAPKAKARKKAKK